MSTTRSTTQCLTPLAIMLLVTTFAVADSIRLHRSAESAGPEIRLADVAELDGTAAVRLADATVATFSSGQMSIELSAELLRQNLTESGANWADLSLMGFASVIVERIESAETESFHQTPLPVAVEPGMAASNPDQPVRVETPRTLRQQILRQLSQQTGVDLQDLALHADPRDRSLLDRPLFGERYTIELGPEGAGYVAILSRVAAAIDETPRRARLRVFRKDQVLVARTPLRRGDVLRARDLEVRSLELPLDQTGYYRSVEQVGGLLIGRSIGAGEPIAPSDLLAEEVVKRGDLIHVTCVIGSMQVRTIATARDNGAIGDTVALRSNSSGRTFYGVVTGDRQARVDTPGILAMGESR
ncbi:MAG: flagellar basal body P-ring formation chaperone FlgA [Phycisphaeraceae bacterium]